LKNHPAADLFPLMSEEELRALADDIKKNGQHIPILRTSEGEILDGRNRLAACNLVGIEPDFREVNGDDPLALVVSMNILRRNLTAGQKAIAAAEAWDLLNPIAGRPGKAAAGGGITGERAERLSKMFGVGKTSIKEARALLERDPALAREVKLGMLVLKHAYDALTEREAVIRRLQTLTDESVGVETLPAPGVQPVTEEERRAAADRMSHRRDDEALKAWESVLSACKEATFAVREVLPDFPEGEEELLRLAAREMARHLEDAAARIVEKIKQTQTLRRVR
jgi:ParB-like chromosome segregation protein Spo0J